MAGRLLLVDLDQSGGKLPASLLHDVWQRDDGAEACGAARCVDGLKEWSGGREGGKEGGREVADGEMRGLACSVCTSIVIMARPSSDTFLMCAYLRATVVETAGAV